MPVDVGQYKIDHLFPFEKINILLSAYMLDMPSEQIFSVLCPHFNQEGIIISHSFSCAYILLG
jgi:hypothetical protein